MPVMSKKKQPFITDESLSPTLKPYLPADSRTTVECGLRKGTKDYPWIMDLCQREQAMLVTADLGFGKHVARYQREHNDCCWGLLLLPDNEGKQIEMLKRLKEGKIIQCSPNRRKCAQAVRAGEGPANVITFRFAESNAVLPSAFRTILVLILGEFQPHPAAADFNSMLQCFPGFKVEVRAGTFDDLENLPLVRVVQLARQRRFADLPAPSIVELVWPGRRSERLD